MTRLLLIDNYDSFTYNLAHQLFRVTGCRPLVHRNDALTIDQVEELRPDAIVLSPGPGSPSVASDLGVCAAILTALDTPVLGVCLGYQALVLAAGGQVGRTDPVHGRTSPIEHVGRDLFTGVAPRFEAVRYHSLAAATPLPGSLELTAWTEDGVAMGVRHRERAAWGLQFHPESICTQYGDRLISNFLDLAGRARPAVLSTGWSAPGEPARSTRPAGSLRCHYRRSSWVDPEDVFVGLYATAEHAFWLDSSQTGSNARYSFLGAPRAGALRLSYDVIEHRLTRVEHGRVEHRSHSILDALAEELTTRADLDTDGLPLPFVGGFVGYLGYEVGADCTDQTPVSARGADERAVPPDAHWMLADRFVAFDHQTRTVYLVAVGAVEDPECTAWLDEVTSVLAGVSVASPPPVPPGDQHVVRLGLDRDPDRYRFDIVACQEAIRAGESYELCLTTQVEIEPVAAPLDLYRVLRRVSPAPYAAYLRLGDADVLCSSPERFLAVDSDRVVTSKPMKGTAPRHRDPAADWWSRESLRTSVKERAENLMIVDLLRNDLGRVCEPDSVAVPVLMEVETYATVHQLVSTVSGRLAPGRGAVDCVRAAFPGGSMTGAPKGRSMQILHKLEPRRRGIYSGSLGYFGLDGRAELNIVIRTAVVTSESTTVGLGGAITVLSDPDAEFDEIVLKAQGMVRAICGWQRRPFSTEAYVVTGPQVDQHV
ncbi:MAG TPA: aminodeoxychorismate synthase component I [Propionibacteriaceae bacterium]